MHPVVLTDPGDPRLADYRALQDLGHRADPRRFIAESELAVERLLASDLPVASVLGTASHLARLAPALATRPEVAVYAAEQPLIRDVVGFNFHRGVAACGLRPARLRWTDLPEETGDDDLSEWTSLLARPRWTIALAQGLVDPANVGAIVRSARAFAVDLLLLDRRGADPLSRRAIRAAMGNVFAQPVAGVRDLAGVLARLRRTCPDTGVYAATLGPRAHTLPVARPERLVLMVGSEGEGLPGPLIAAADREVTIPIAPGVDSLGVAAATAVLLYALAGPAGPHDIGV